MNELKVLVQQVAGEFIEIDRQREELKQSIAANEEKHRSATLLVDVKSMKHYSREIQEERGILEMLEGRRAAMVEQNGTKLYHQLGAAAASAMKEAEESQKESMDKARSLLQEVTEVLGEVKGEESAAAERIRQYISAAASYAEPNTRNILGRLSGMSSFPSINSQQEAIKEVLKKF